MRGHGGFERIAKRALVGVRLPKPLDHDRVQTNDNIHSWPSAATQIGKPRYEDHSDRRVRGPSDCGLDRPSGTRVYRRPQPVQSTRGKRQLCDGHRKRRPVLRRRQINKFSYQPPPRSGTCPGWGNLFWLDQGNPAYLKCDGGPLVYPTPPPLGWEQTQSLGPLLCQNSNENPSLPRSTLCKDNSSSHYFRIYPDHYLLG